MKYQTQIISIIEQARTQVQQSRFWERHLAHPKRWLKGLALAGLVLFFGLLAVTHELVSSYAHYAALVEARLADETFYQTGGIYAAPRQVSVGQALTPAQLAEYLLRANYQAGATTNEFASGNFLAQDTTLEIHTNAFARSAQLPAVVQVQFKQAQLVKLTNQETGAALNVIALPAEMLTSDLHLKQQTRRSTTYDELPDVLRKALCAVEDRRFYEHHGVDFQAILRAAYRNLRHGSIREGGSTLTQQLAKNQFLTPARTWERKLTEALMALALERRLSKQQIMELYCNRVYLGQSGITAVFGFRQGAQVFLGKELSDLTLGEAAFLVGLVKAPSRYAPHTHLNAALARRQVVLQAMRAAGFISVAEATASQSEDIALQPPPKLDATAAPHFVDYVSRTLMQERISQGIEDVDWKQTRVETTLDLNLQQAASQAIQTSLPRLQKLLGKRAAQGSPQVALVALNPQTGAVLALVGGNDYATSQLNRVTDAQRQPGSVFKPVVYAAALTHGITPATTYVNARRSFEYGQQAVYQPENFGRSYSGEPVTLRESLVRSLNVVTVEAALEIGLNNVASMAQRLGLPRPQAYPSLALGAFEATPLEIAEAYTTFANHGTKAKSFAIQRILLKDTPLVSHEPESSSVLSSAVAYLITDALTDVVNRGTAARVRQAGYRGPAAGKTGTSRDAWFVGYTPKLLAVVWVGYDDNRDLNLTGGDAAAPIWAEFIKRALAVQPELSAKQFARPQGLETVEICSLTGALANPYCPQRQKLLVTSYLTPGECTEHQPLPLFEATYPSWGETGFTSSPAVSFATAPK